jgi:hypothetical protein
MTRIGIVIAKMAESLDLSMIVLIVGEYFMLKVEPVFANRTKIATDETVTKIHQSMAQYYCAGEKRDITDT